MKTKLKHSGVDEYLMTKVVFRNLGKNGRWAKKRQNRECLKFGSSIIIWGAIHSKLITVRETFNSQKYQDIVKEAEESFTNLFDMDFFQ